jgi:hypothetical protein
MSFRSATMDHHDSLRVMRRIRMSLIFALVPFAVLSRGVVGAMRAVGARWGALACGLGVIASALVAVPARGEYDRFSCGGHGISSLLAAGNGRGEALVVWEDGEQSEVKFCESSVADAAVGSVSSGFASLGMVSAPGKLSYATGVSLDEAGDGWVVGLHEKFGGYQQYGATYETSGVWAAFRPAGGSFRAPVELPAKGGPPQMAWVASNSAGRTLLAWDTTGGTYLAFGTAAGSISKPTFIGGGFQVSGLGVDENGRALVVGYYGSKKYEVVRIAAVTAGVSGSFSRPRVLVAQPRNVRKGLIGYMFQPLVAIGPRGNAVIAWESIWANRRTTYEFAGPNLLMYRRADGRFDRPVRLPKGFLSGNAAAAVDSAGRAVIVSPAEDLRGLEEVAVSPAGRAGSPHFLSKATSLNTRWQFCINTTIGLASRTCGVFMTTMIF